VTLHDSYPDMGDNKDPRRGDRICVTITNYDFSDSADRLKREFQKYLPTVLIDAQSPHPPSLADYTIQNTYYPGLWNAAVHYASSHKFQWLMFVASDVEIRDFSLLCRLASELTRFDAIGIYTPSLSASSRVSFPSLLNRKTGSLRECGLAEGFFFLSRTELLEKVYPIDKRNRSGWGVDVMACYLCYASRRIAVVDDRIQIYHPPRKREHAINVQIAATQQMNYLGKNINKWFIETRAKFAADNYLLTEDILKP